jgi:hypothetical protein
MRSVPPRPARPVGTTAPVAILVLLLGSVPPLQVARAQDASGTLVNELQSPLGGPAEDVLRRSQLLGERGTAGHLLRSHSSRVAALPPSPGSFRWALLGPDVRVVHNSALPYSINDGSLWAGRGLNTMASAGLLLRAGRLTAVLAPEFLYSANDAYELHHPASAPPRPGNRSPFVSPWHVGPNSVDMPIRFGDEPLRHVRVGQSTVQLDAGLVTIGVSSENEWWGPGVRNALVLSNNAPGFPHLLLGTTRPIVTRFGKIEGRWLVGGLSESRFFTSERDDDLRSISLLGITWQLAGEQGLTFGAARAVYGVVPGWGDILPRAFDVFADVGQPNARASSDTTRVPGRDQVIALFARWVFPSDGFEAYAEWGRAEFPVSLRDFLEQPNHSQGYTLGLQWIGDPRWLGGRPRTQLEMTYLQRSTTYRFRPIGSWYTSRAVEAGYTNEGQVLGAGIGPGGSSQWLAVDYLTPSWEIGATLKRIRWLEDVHQELEYNPRESIFGFNDHDVSFLTGVRGVVRTRVGTVTADFTSGWRLNTFFPLAGRARHPLPPGNDIRNRTLSLRYSLGL